MFASLILAALAAFAGQQVVIPFGKPKPVERPKAPIETSGPAFAAACKDWDDWDKPAPPVRIHANTFLVGTCGISAILITGSDGHILIDAGTAKGADLIVENIRTLGFRPRDIKYLLHSHEHFDHSGGLARLQRLSGGQMVASAPAASVLRTGAPDAQDPQAGMHQPMDPVRVDRVVKDGDTVRLGNLMLTAVGTPGHTPGALSWTWVSCDGGVCRRMVYADSLTPVSRDDYRFSDHPAYVAAFRASLARVRSLECEILMTPHPSASDMIKRMSGKAALFDENGCRAYADGLTKKLDERLAKETASK